MVRFNWLGKGRFKVVTGDGIDYGKNACRISPYGRDHRRWLAWTLGRCQIIFCLDMCS